MERVLAGRYELEVLLGRGGSGQVWRGRDMATHRPVAVKIAELAAIDDLGLLAETIGRFRREAIAIAGLRDPNIAAPLDAGRVGRQLFTIEELAPGQSVASLMDDRGLRGAGLFPVPTVLRIAEQASRGLAAAHDEGIVHRDIKPSSLMASPQLDVRVIDFGMARLLAENSPRLLMPGQTASSAAYLSPEQVTGDEVDGRSDLYALGCVLYHLLAGRLPFRSALPSALLMMQVMDQATPLDVVRPDLPAGLPELVADLMAKERAARPGSAAEVISRLAAIDGYPAPVREPAQETVQAPEAAAYAGGDGAAPEPVRSAVLTPGRLALDPAGAGSSGAGSSGAGSSGGFGAEAVHDRDYRRHPDTEGVPAWGPPGGTGQPVQDPRAHPIPVGWTVPPARVQASDPQPAARGSGGPPAGRPRRRWLGILGLAVIALVAAGVWGYVWYQTHHRLVVSSVVVGTRRSRLGCSGTATLVGTITTNGRAGQISYEWLRSNQPAPLKGQVDAHGGENTVQVTLQWPFHSKGVGMAVAQLRVLSPGQDEGKYYIPFSCPA